MRSEPFVHFHYIFCSSKVNERFTVCVLGRTDTLVIHWGIRVRVAAGHFFGKHTGHQSIASHFHASNRMDYREMVDEESKPEEQIVLFENPKAREKKYWEFILMITPSHSRRPQTYRRLDNP